MNLLPVSADLIVMIVLLIIIVLIVAVLRALFLLLPAIIVGGVIWFLTHNLLFTAVAFLIIAVLSFVRRH
jgi:membrane protein implicated in regulation of membrane protease activity